MPSEFTAIRLVWTGRYAPVLQACLWRQRALSSTTLDVAKNQHKQQVLGALVLLIAKL